VHCRCVAGHVSDRPAFVRSIGKVLKPGGVLLFSDGNVEAFDAQKQPVPPADTSVSSDGADGRNAVHNGSWYARWMVELVTRMPCRSEEKFGGDYLGWFLRNDLDAQFEAVDEKAFWSPIGWDGGEGAQGLELSKLMSGVITEFVPAGKPLLLSTGVPSEVVDTWVQNVRSDVYNSTAPWYMKWGYAWAVKRGPTDSSK